MPTYTRRSFVMIGLGLLAGCASGTKDSASRELAGRDPLPNPYTPEPRPPIYRPDDPTWGGWMGRRSAQQGQAALGAGAISGVRPRSLWATSAPVPNRMNVMTPIRRITVHHDGMEPFYASAEADSVARIDAIRHAHQAMGWGDIGYHYVIDRGGRVWEGRPINYQGAHVKDYNEGNIGVMLLGNFDRQDPTGAQLQALQLHLGRLSAHHRISAREVHTHQELRPTACPGRSLQRYMVNLRASGALA